MAMGKNGWGWKKLIYFYYIVFLCAHTIIFVNIVYNINGYMYVCV